ncbi:MAG TPA: acetyl-CoA carboxyl transferase, partial [Pseudonocardiaceae bacterium]|nr:acetyl-CoA carboxyl transferase [Pseudonocardiaceae bacterium]
WLSPLPPEGASAILHHGDTSFAPELAEAQGVTAHRLVAAGLVDVVVPDPDDDPARFAHDLVAAVAAQLATARDVPPVERLTARAERFRTRH